MKRVQVCIKRLKEDPEHIIDRCEILYNILEEYISEHGSITIITMEGHQVVIYKIGILFDDCFIRYCDNLNKVIDKTLDLRNIQEVIE